MVSLELGGFLGEVQLDFARPERKLKRARFNELGVGYPQSFSKRKAILCFGDLFGALRVHS
jgi:hypothetical protein